MGDGGEIVRVITCFPVVYHVFVFDKILTLRIFCSCQVASGIITWVCTKFLKSKGINRKNKIEIQRSDIGFFNYLKYLANESKAEKWVKRLVTL